MEGILTAEEGGMLARYLRVTGLSELHEAFARIRYIEGQMVEIDGDTTHCLVLIPACRVQMIFELPE